MSCNSNNRGEGEKVMIMKNTLLSPLGAAFHGARLAGAEIVPNFPAPFSNLIVKKLKTAHNCNIINCESQSSAINAAIGACLGEKRVFLPLTIPKCLDEFYMSSFLRLPIVAANVSRSVFSYSSNADHNNILSLRDSGWLIFMPSTVEDIIYSILQAYAICEDSKVLLPGIVNIEMPMLRETAQIPTEQFSRKFLPRLRLPHKVDLKKPEIIVPVDDYKEFVMQQQKAMSNAAQIFARMNDTYGKKLKKELGMTEKYKLDDAELVIVIAGFQTATARAAVDKMREQGKKVGLLRLRVIRPWPSKEIADALANVKRIAIIDQDISLGHTGILYNEIKTDKFASNFIALAKHFSEKDFFAIADRTDKSDHPERVWL
jgi:pyruvate/2-oxoacid:ferredoxin oxidoreductase alpha subunit